MTNEEKAREIINCGNWCESINKCDYKNTGVNCYAYGVAMEMAEWKDEQIAEAKELLRLCYNTILGITGLDTPEEIAKARKSHDSSLIKRIELFMYNNQ